MSILRLLEAIDFAAEKHRHQRRKGGEQVPYINHPVHVARLVAEVGGVEDVDVLMAAVLHDTIEDTDATREELERRFGSRVTGLVLEVTDDKSLPKAERKARQVSHALELSPGAAVIKLADKTANVHDLAHAPPADWPRERVREYLDWAARVVANIPPVNPPLVQHFAEVLAASRMAVEA